MGTKQVTLTYVDANGDPDEKQLMVEPIDGRVAVDGCKQWCVWRAARGARPPGG